MKYAVITLLLLAPAITTVAVAQEGGGHGPPASAPVIVPKPTTLPTQTAPSGSPKSLSAQVGTSLNEVSPAISVTRRRGLQVA